MQADSTTLICEFCGQIFTPARKGKRRPRFCSRQCAAANRLANSPFTCTDCGKNLVSNSPRCKPCSIAHSRQKHAAKKRKTAVCKNCGVTFDLPFPGMKRVYCSRECSDSVNKNPPAKIITRMCEECGSAFTQPDWRGRRRVRYCSTTCSGKAASRTIVGKNHPLYKPKKAMKCRVCGKTCMVKPSLASRFRVCSARCRGVWSQQFINKVSSLEVAMAKLFDSANLDYTAQMYIGPYIVDFAFASERVVVECDGSYWHSLPGMPEKDRRKDEFLINEGWKVVRLGEDDIIADSGACLGKVIATLHGDLSFVQARHAPITDKQNHPKQANGYVQQSLEEITPQT